MTRRLELILLAYAACIIVLAGPAYGYGTQYQDMLNLVSESEDLYVTSDDLAFILATHNFDTTPEDGWVRVVIGNDTYRLVPNGDRPGLAEIVHEGS